MTFLLPYKLDHEDYTLSKWDGQPAKLFASCAWWQLLGCLATHTSINLATKDMMSPNRLRQFIIVSRAGSLNFRLVQFPWLTRSQGLMAHHRPTVHIVRLCHRKSPRFLALPLFPWDVSKSSSVMKGRGFYLLSWNITGEWAIFYSVLECTIVFVQIKQIDC